MSSIASAIAMGSPGVRPSQVCESLDDHHAERLLPTGALELVMSIAPERLNDSRRAKTLGDILSIERAVDDPTRREILLNAVPTAKVGELEDRVGMNIASLLRRNPLPHAVRRSLLGFFGLSRPPDRTRIAEEPATAVRPRRGLFAHQKRAATAVEQYLYFDEGRAMLHLPTGVGKTRTAMSIIASHLRARSMGVVLWLAATRELLEQAAREFEATWETVGDRQVDCLRFWSSHNPPIDKVRDGIVVAGLGKLHSYGKNRERLWDLGDRTTMVVFDEAHQAVAATYRDIVETVVTRKPKTPLLGLSATPGRTWGEPDVDAAVADLFCQNKVVVDFGGGNPIRHLTAAGYLAQVNFVPLNVESSLKLSRREIAKISEARDLPKGIANRLGVDGQRNLQIMECLIALTARHQRILVFAISVDNALLLASVCKGLGLRADVVTAETGTVERENAIRRFKLLGGPCRILINFGVFTTGFDAPAASAVLIGRATKSLVLYSQMVGRAMRGPKAGGTESCEVVTVVDTTLPGFGDVTEAFMNWEDVWNTA